MDGIGTGDPHTADLKEFRTRPVFKHSLHTYRVLPWLVNLGFPPAELHRLRGWASTSWPGPEATRPTTGASPRAD